jgi:hypothetical protein
MPALNLLALYNKQFKKELRLVGDIAMMAGGLGEFQAAKGLRAALGVLEAAYGAADIVVEDLRPEIGQTPAGRRFLEVWDTISILVGLYGLARVAMTVPNVFRNLRSLYEVLRRRIGQVEKVLSEAEQVSVLVHLLNTGVPDPQAQRLAPLLEKAGVTVGELDDATVAALRRAEEALDAKRIDQAVTELDTVGKSVGPVKRAGLETSLTEARNITDLDFYRDPYVLLPDGTKVRPTARGGRLYHGTSDVDPKEAFSSGLPVRGRNLSLEDHVNQKGDSALRGAAPMPQFPTGKGGPADWGEYVYEIDGVPSWDANQLLQGRVRRPGGFGGNLMTAEVEQAIPGYVPPSKIVRWGRSVQRNGRNIVEWQKGRP